MIDDVEYCIKGYRICIYAPALSLAQRISRCASGLSVSLLVIFIFYFRSKADDITVQ